MSADTLFEPAPAAARPAVSWGAILAGAAAAGAMTLSLLLLGSAFGLSIASPWPSATASATTFAMSSAIGLILTQWVSAALGGYLAGRLRTSWPDVDADETFFRDTAHGFLTWCVATLVVFTVVSILAGATARTAAEAVGSAASGTTKAAGSLVETNLAPYLTDRLFRPAAGATSQSGGELTALRDETSRIVTAGIASGELPQADRAYIAQQVASKAGIPQEEAQRRVDELVNSIQSAKAKAQETAEQVRKAAARGAIFGFLSLLIGAFIGSVAAAWGGSLREKTT